MKGLPLAYQKDMQEDKEGAIDAFGALSLCLARHDRHGARHRARCGADAGGGRRGLCHRHRSRRLAGANAENAVPRGPPCHRPHRRAAAEQPASRSTQLPLEAMQAIEPRITKAVFGVLSVDHSVASRVSLGGTAPKNVRVQAKRWLARLGGNKK